MRVTCKELFKKGCYNLRIYLSISSFLVTLELYIQCSTVI